MLITAGSIIPRGDYREQYFVKVWDFEEEERLHKLIGYHAPILKIDDEHFVCTVDRSIGVHNILSGERVKYFKLRKKNIDQLLVLNSRFIVNVNGKA